MFNHCLNFPESNTFYAPPPFIFKSLNRYKFPQFLFKLKQSHDCYFYLSPFILKMLRETNLQSSGHVEGMGSASLPIATPYAIAMSLIPEQKNYH